MYVIAVTTMTLTKEKLCGNCGEAGHKYVDCPIIDLQFPPTKKAYNQLEEKAEKMERVDSLFTELEIPLPYDLWLAESLQIRELLKKRKEFYVDDLHKCNEQGLHGKSLHYESIIEAFRT